MIARATMEFSLWNFGWRESWLFSVADLDEAILKLNAFKDVRLNCLVPAGVLQFYRVASLDQAPNTSRVVAITDGQGTYGTQARDQGKVVVNAPVISVTGHKRTFQMHGVPDNSIDFDAVTGAPKPMPGIANRINAYLTSAKAAGASLAIRKKKFNDDTLPAVQDITIDNDGVHFTVALDPVPVAGTRIEVRGGRGFHIRQTMGAWRVGSYTAGVLTVSSKRLLDPRLYYVKGSARVRVSGVTNYGIDPISRWRKEDFVASTRKVGRPPEQPRGRTSGQS